MPVLAISVPSFHKFRPRTAEAAIYFIIIASFLVVSMAPWLVSAVDPITPDIKAILQPPGPGHPFGTDQIGRDQLSRVAHGAALSLKAAAIAVIISLFAGGILGLIAGYAGGVVDSVIARLCDTLLAIPNLLLALAILAALGRGTVTAAVAIGLSAVPTFARVMRAEVMRTRTLSYVEASRMSGAFPVVVLIRHVLPNSWSPVASLSMLEFGQAMLSIGALSYLGFGEQPPTPEWGALIAAGQPYLSDAWWLSVIPGSILALVVVILNRLVAALQGDRNS